MERKELVFEIAEKKENSKVKNFFSKKVNDLAKQVPATTKVIADKMPSADEMKESAKDLAKKGLKGGIVGASAAAVNGVVAGATSSAIGALAAKGICGAMIASGATAAVPIVAGFSAACVVGNIVSSVVNKE